MGYPLKSTWKGLEPTNKLPISSRFTTQFSMPTSQTFTVSSRLNHHLFASVIFFVSGHTSTGKSRRPKNDPSSRVRLRLPLKLQLQFSCKSLSLPVVPARTGWFERDFPSWIPPRHFTNSCYSCYSSLFHMAHWNSGISDWDADCP